MSTRAADQWFFDSWSRGYDAVIAQRLAYRPVHDAVLQALNPGAGRVLDIGCGTGELAQRIRDEHPGTAVVGCDFSTGMLARARAKNQAASWVQGDACRLPFRDGAFDVVISTEAFHWFPDQDAALREACRVLAHDGRLLLALRCAVRREPDRRSVRSSSVNRFIGQRSRVERDARALAFAWRTAAGYSVFREYCCH
jgi:ubiquinone/menaquinone biosynthesis C-methylase UbiE